MIVQIDQVSKGFGSHEVLDKVSAQIDGHQRVGLIGANGAGKSTLLNLINEDLEPDEGRIIKGSGVRYGFLRQDSGLTESSTIGEEMLSVFSSLLKMEKTMRQDEKELSNHPVDSPQYGKIAQRYATMQGQFELQEGYQIGAKIDTILGGMGFGDVDRNKAIGVLSGGEKTRLGLCKLLLENPELLILDEPTNHLDFATLLWLENYLQDYRGAILVVSHDRYFLNRLCNRIWEVEHKNLSIYKGNYTQYLTLKEEALVFQKKQYELQQEEIARHKDFIARNLVRASTTGRAQARQKVLEKMALIPYPKAPPRPPKLHFTVRREPVSDVLQVMDLSIQVGQPPKLLFQDLSLHVKRGEKIGIVGQNGIGKSSMFKAILDQIPYTGQVVWGRNTDVSYFDQQDGALNPDNTVMNQLWDDFPRDTRFHLQSMLGQVGFTGVEVDKKVGDLSGGEKARLKFAKIMLEQSNVILLDEPTNHLDLPANEELDSSLVGYEGTLLVISHDRYLLDKFPDKILEMDEDGFRIYAGRYEDYLEAKEKEKQVLDSREDPEEKQEEASATKGNFRGKEQRQRAAWRRKRLGAVEEDIFKLEEEKEALDKALQNPDLASDYVALEQCTTRLEQVLGELNSLVSEWALLGEEDKEDI